MRVTTQQASSDGEGGVGVGLGWPLEQFCISSDDQQDVNEISLLLLSQIC